MKTFKSILEFQKEFSTDAKCRKHLEQQRWGKIPACPFCGSINVHRHPNGKKFNCNEKECRKIFSVTVGTIYENSKLPLTKWYLATYILSVHSKGISSLQLANWLGITQKSAWHLNHRIRQMLTNNEPQVLEDIVEIDESYLGGLESNKHKSKRTGVKGGTTGKTMVIGAVQRGGKLITRVIPATNIENIQNFIKETVKPESIMVTDEHHAYNKVGENYNHKKVNHREKEYVRRGEIKGDIHTNTIEGYWNILKKQIDGIHHSVSPKHLQRYCNENAFRYNNKELLQDERFEVALKNIEGKLPYKTLIQNA